MKMPRSPLIGLNCQVLSEADVRAKQAEHKGKASTKPWEETQIQKGVLRRENTLMNLGEEWAVRVKGL